MLGRVAIHIELEAVAGGVVTDIGYGHCFAKTISWARA